MNVHHYSGLLGAACLLTPAYGGLMSDSFDVQTYRDFAENRGIFDVNAKDVAIYDKNGNYVGTIPKMMNFDGVADAHIGEAALVGGPGFIATVSHDYYNHFVSFTVRFGAKQGTPFYDSYRSVTRKDAWGDKSDLTYDYRVQRLSKIDLTLRNNITTPEHPLGVYHPHVQYHHIKKENIGLIEVMGLAVLPARLKEEMELLKEYILTGKDVRSNEKIDRRRLHFEPRPFSGRN